MKCFQKLHYIINKLTGGRDTPIKTIIMKDKHHPFENEIFTHFREEQAEINKAISLLKRHGYFIYKKQQVK